jgi:hypothetical protein
MLPQLQPKNAVPVAQHPASDTAVMMTAVNIDRRRPLLQSLLADVRATAAAADSHSSSSMSSFATALGDLGARFMNGSLNGGSGDSLDTAILDPVVQLRPSVGAPAASTFRESFPGFPSFGNFPSFAVVPLLPGDRLNLSPRTRSRQLSQQKLRLAKSKSAADCPTDGFR